MRVVLQGVGNDNGNGDDGNHGGNGDDGGVFQPRYHIDIETDDVDAEVRRLERLGARRVRRVESWWIMEAPTGQLLCVIPPSYNDFPDNARAWED